MNACPCGATHDDTSPRGRLIAALHEQADEDFDWSDAEQFADALAPAVDRIAKERAAAEMRAVAHRLDDGGDEAIEVALGGAAYVHRVLCDTARALDGKP